MSKRGAAIQLNKDRLDNEEDRQDYEYDGESQSTQEEISKRQISVPKSRLAGNTQSSNKIANLFAKPAKKEEPTDNPWIKVRGLNASFSKSIQAELEKDPLSDLSRFFEQYLNYWTKLSQDFPSEIKPALGSHKNVASVEHANEEESGITKKLEGSPMKTEESAPAKFNFTFPSSEIPALPSATTQLKPFSFSKPAESVEDAKPAAFNFSTPAETRVFSFNFADSQESQPIQKEFRFSFNKPQGTTAPFGIMSPSATQSQPKEEASQEAADDEPLEPAQISLIRTGAGEEDEESIAEARVKLFNFVKEDGWKDLGVGIFKVNKRKSEAATETPNRILCRSEASGLVLLNSAILAAGTTVDYTEGKKDFKLICINQEGKPATYLVKTKEEEHSRDLVKAINELKH